MLHLLKNSITKHISLSATEMDRFCNLFQHKKIAKKQYVLRKEGKFPNVNIFWIDAQIIETLRSK